PGGGDVEPECRAQLAFVFRGRGFLPAAPPRFVRAHAHAAIPVPYSHLGCGALRFGHVRAPWRSRRGDRALHRIGSVGTDAGRLPVRYRDPTRERTGYDRGNGGGGGGESAALDSTACHA